MLLGNAISLSTTVTDPSGTAADPATLTLVVTKPDSTTDTFSIGSLTHGSTGNYSYTYTPSTVGDYTYEFTATVPNFAFSGSFFIATAGAPLVTLADAKAFLAETDSKKDSLVSDFIEAATELVEQEVGAVRAKPVTETFDGGTPEIVLNYYPVLSVQSVTEYSGGSENDLMLVTAPFSGTTYGYRADLALGRIVRWSGAYNARFACGWQNVTVNYTAGRQTIPPAIKQATLLLVQHMWETQQSGRTTGKGANNTPAAGYTMPYRVVEALRPYARPPRIA